MNIALHLARAARARGDAPAVDETTLDRFCLRHLARFKRPRIYRSIESLPKNNYGKVVKRVLREREGGSRRTCGHHESPGESGSLPAESGEF